MTTQQPDELPEALDLADWLIGVGGGPSAQRAAALLRSQHARITELESQLAQRFDAADMATAAAQGFRDGATAQAQPVAELSYEHQRAIMEGERNASLDAYSRVIYLTGAESQLYEAGFTNGWQRAAHGQAPAPEDSVQEDALSDSVRTPLDSLHADAAYLIGRLRDGSMPYVRVIEIIRERIDAAKAAIRARAAHGQAPAPAESVTAPGGGVVAAGRFMDEAAERRSAQEGYEKRIKRVSERNPHDEGMYSLGWWDRAWKAAAPTPAAQAADSVQEDAARYQWIRGPVEESTRYSRWRIEYWDGPNGWQPMQRERMDSAIDAARKQGVSHDR